MAVISAIKIIFIAVRRQDGRVWRMDDTLITAREIDLNKKIYIAIKSNLKTAKDFHDAIQHYFAVDDLKDDLKKW